MNSHRFEGPAGQLHYLAAERSGKPVLVLLAGLTCHARYWEGVWQELARDHEVYALDWRGHGDSAPAERYGFGDYQADLAAFLAHVGARDALLVGHSLGGYVALRYAAEHPVRGVVACDVKTGITPEELEGGRKAAGKPQAALADLAEAVRRLKLGLADGAAPDEVVEALARAGTRENADGTVSFKFDRRALALEPLDLFGFLGRVQAPVLVLHGEKSAVMDAAAARAVGEALPEGRWGTLVGAGHHAFLDAPEDFARMVGGFSARGR